MSRRTERIGNLIQKELSEFIYRELSDSRVGFVTLSRVDVTADLSLARIRCTVMGTDKEKRDTLAGLSHAASYMRKHLAKVMKTRTVPKLDFIEDKNLEHGFHINEILRGIRNEDEKKAGTTPPTDPDPE